MKLFWLITSLTWAVIVLSVRADSGEEDRLIAVLQSSASHAEKEDACRRLKQIGGPRSVPVLAELLRDDHLIQAACDALETMPVKEVDATLRSALKDTVGTGKAGIIHAIGERRDAEAVKPLAALLADEDPLVASSAARALGVIGGKEASRALLTALKLAHPPLRAAVVDALLQCATRLLAEGERDAAVSVFRQLAVTTETEQVRVAAFIGLLRTAGKRELTEIVSAIKGSDTAKQAAAFQVAREVGDPGATKAFTNLLSKVSPAKQIALLDVLQQRGDANAGAALIGVAGSSDRDVRLAAITALGTLGDASAVPVLAGAATARDESEQKAARVALAELPHGNVAEAMVGQLATTSPEVQAELVRALTARNDKSAVPILLELARAGTGPAQRAALRGLEQLAGPEDLPSLVKLLLTTNGDVYFSVLDVCEALANRAGAGGKIDVTPIVTAFEQGNTRERLAMLQAGVYFPDRRLRAHYRAELKDSDLAIRAAAARSLCDTRDPELLPDLLEIARDSRELGSLAFEHYIRFIGDDANGITGLRRVELLRPAYELAESKEQKWSVLAALAGTVHPEALEVANRGREDEATKVEAEIACAKIAKSLLNSEPAAATRMLRQLATDGSNLSVRTNAQAVLKQFDSGWVYAGPFRQSGKQCRELFDVEFPPEQSSASQVKWSRASGTPDLARPGEVNLADAVGGDHCVVYLKTRVFIPKTQTVTLEIGSDDGLKLWGNGDLVHANNAVRGLAPAQDRTQANLREGWNDLLAKITQSTAGCGMILRIVDRDGAEIQGAKFDPNGGQ